MNFRFGFSLTALGALIALAAFACSSSQETGAAASVSTAGAANPISADPQITAILTSACFGCHTTGGSAPWYAAVSPTYLAAGSARNVLNFSDWQSYDGEKKAAELRSIAESVKGGSMPPGDYTALDHSARLSEDQKRTLINWAKESGAALSAH